MPTCSKSNSRKEPLPDGNLRVAVINSGAAMKQQKSLLVVFALIFAMTALLFINPFGRNIATHDEGPLQAQIN